MNNPIDFFKSLFKNRKTTLTGNEVVSLPYLHPEKGAINSGDYCTTQDIANLVTITPAKYPKIYKALLTQSGSGNPIATVFNSSDSNYIGNISWRRTDTGLYTGALSGITQPKTFVLITGVDKSINIKYSISDNKVNLNSYTADENNIDGLSGISIYIEQYL